MKDQFYEILKYHQGTITQIMEDKKFKMNSSYKKYSLQFTKVQLKVIF